MGARRTKVIVGALLALLLVGAYALTLSRFTAEADARGNPTTVSDGAGADHVTVHGVLVGVDPVKGEGTVRLTFTPEGTWATGDGKLSKDLVLSVDSATGMADRPFEKGKAMSPSDVVVSLVDGAVTDYPFDSTTANVGFYLSTKAVSAAPAEGAKPAVEAVAAEPVEVNFDLEASVHGFDISTAPDPDSTGPFAGIDLTVHRSGSTVFFSVFVMLLMWSLALAAVGVAWRVVALGTKAELPMCTMLAALLFAFPAVRNVQPSAPPIGALSDFIAFFWCEALVAVSLVMVLGSYLFRTLRTPKPAAV